MKPKNIEKVLLGIIEKIEARISKVEEEKKELDALMLDVFCAIATVQHGYNFYRRKAGGKRNPHYAVYTQKNGKNIYLGRTPWKAYKTKV